MKRILITILLLISTTLVFAAGDSETHNTLPTVGTSFISRLSTFLADEDADRFNDMFVSFIVAGGTHATMAGVTATPNALSAYPGGWYITETNSIVYPSNATCWVIATRDKTGNITTFARVANTHYAIDCFSALQPELPENSVYLMRVVTTGGAITTVDDLRTLSPLDVATPGPTSIFGSGIIGDLLFYNSTSTIAHLADTTTGNALISGGVGSAPLWGKITLANHTTGTLSVARGGTGITTTPSNGYIPIGNAGTGAYTSALITGGTGITVTPGVGSLTIAATGTPANAKSGTTITISNSAAETTIFTTTLTAGKMGTSNRFRFSLHGRLNNTSGAGRVYTFRVKYGGTTLYSCAPSIGSGITNTGVILEGSMSEIGGATNSQFTANKISWDDKMITCSGTAASALDSTIDQTFAITLQLATASVNETYTMQHAMTEIIQ